MIAKVLDGSEGEVENMGPQMKGIIEELDTMGAAYSKIRGEDGRIYRFFFGTCVGKSDTFNDLKVGMPVIFNNFTGAGKIMWADLKDVKIGLVAVNVAIDAPQTTNLSSQTKDTIDWIMKWGAESLDNDAKMVEKLERLDTSVEAASKLYEERFGQNYANIQGMITNIGYGMADGLNSDNVDLQVLFAGLQGSEISAEDAEFFRELQSKFMEKSPETQASMLWFLELVNDYVVSKSNDLSIQTNPLKNVLFNEKDVSYKDWIIGTFDGFERNEVWMDVLIESIRNADAPQIGLKQFIRHLYDTRPEVMHTEDFIFLQALYIQWPDEAITNKPNTISKEDKAKRDGIAKKYLVQYSERGTAWLGELMAAKSFKELVSNRN